MDPQSSAVYESPTIIKYGLSELNFNAVNRSNSSPKVNKQHDDGKKLSSASNASNSSHNKRFIIYPTAGPSGKVSGDSSSSGGHSSLMTSPIMSPSPSMVNTVKHHGSMRSIRSGNHLASHHISPPHSTNYSSPNMLMSPQLAHLARSGSYIFSESGSTRLFSDANSVRSLCSIGMGSTDGRKMVIRRVPNSPSELLGIINPPTPPEDLYDNDSYELSDNEDEQLKPRRPQWSNKMQFVLACIGYSVGLGNVWRFPYLCYTSGGGVFLIPYFIILFICGMPMLFMELAIGQYTGRGPIGALGQICPLFKGAGLSSVIISFIMSTYYSVIIAYSIFYFFTSFKPDLPWSNCSHRWATPDCWLPEMTRMNMTRPMYSRAPTEEFFENKVLQISHGIDHPGGLRWELVACLACAWVLVYFAIWKSIKSSGKVRYLTATLPFVLIIVFLGRALTLPGAEKGLQYFFKPNWSLLKNSNVWINAAAQNFNSFGIAFGSMISFASYNKYNNNILHDTFAVTFVNGVTSLLVGIFAFATIGNIALEQGINVKDVITDGPGLIFVVYPQALSKMPAPQMWAVLFFFMLLCLGLNSQFAIVEVVVTSIQDGFPNWIRNKLVYHELLVLIICVVSFFFGLPHLIQGGMYFFQLVDHYAASVTIMFLAFLQVIAISWFYGVNRLTKNIKQMTCHQPSIYFQFCWFIAAPALLFSLFVFALVNYESPTYHNGKYHYPGWAHGLGWGIVACSLICVPVYAIFNLVKAEGNTFYEKLKNTIKPHIYECKICGEHHCDHEYPANIEELAPIFQNPPIILQSPPIGHPNAETLTIKPPSSESSNSPPNSSKA